ncbi:hypothetical protein [Spongiimicrobium salis]|uniref:hypothetical protein n=1 Tax=Spongiimicrobium salis TaxID=1667022 RepID=UPI00374DC40B
MQFRKVRAGALQFVLFIGAVIAVLLLTFVLLSHSHSLFGKQTQRLVQLVKGADMGLSVALKSPLPLGDTIPLPSHGNEAIVLKGVREYWGVYEKIAINARTEAHHFDKVALVGNGITEDFPALYLEDNERPMIIVGGAKITGDAFLPKQGIRTGNISGNSYYHSNLVYGRQRQSGKKLPPLNKELQRYLQDVGRPTPGSTTTDANVLSSGAILQQSFKESTLFIFGSTINLSRVRLSGNIVVSASRKIIVDPSAVLEDVLLSAPEIEIKDRVRGKFQAIARQHISIGTQCELEYPSALVVTAERPTVQGLQRPLLHMKPNAHVRGALVVLGNFEEQRFYPQLKMEEKASLVGELYCEQNLELKGSVIGRVNTAAFMALENGSIYQNHLYQGTIDRSLLPSQYAGLLYESNTPNKTVSKWLY